MCYYLNSSIIEPKNHIKKKKIGNEKPNKCGVPCIAVEKEKK